MRTILAVTDFSPTASRALEWAAFFAQAWKARLHILHVVPQPGAHPLPRVQKTVEEAVQKVYEERRRKMEEAVETFRAQGVADVEGDVQVGRVVDRIVETSSLADLVVLGLRGEGRGEEGGFIGSTAYRILAGTTQPVLAVPHDAPRPRVSAVLVPVDLSPVSLQAILKALELVKDFDARIYVLHVVELLESLSEEEAEKILQEEVWRVIRTHIPEVHPYGNLALRILRRFQAAPAILDAARDLNADLIVMRTHGRHGILKSLLGSVTEQVLRETRCPVYAFRF